MTLTFTERFLSITMEYDSKVGYKGYKGADGASHQIEVYTISDKKIIEKQGISSYNQYVAPQSITHGKQPEVITVEGPLCYVGSGGTFQSCGNVTTLLNGIGAAHPVNELYNVFIPCCILTASSTDGSLSGSWIVNTFKIKRNMQKRNLVLFELTLYKWYKAVV